MMQDKEAPSYHSPGVPPTAPAPPGDVHSPLDPYLEHCTDGALPAVLSGIKRIYREKILPLEEMYSFDYFHTPYLRDSDFDAKPQILLLGQYSVGKTSFIQWLLGRPFPGQMIGPEPTTDRFIAVMHGAEDLIIPGSALSIQADMPFRAVDKFGTTFLNKFQASLCNVPTTQHLTLIDTPGVLSGEKQRIGRSYDFIQVIEWFASRADMILLLFDAHKLDISDEFKAVIEILKGQDDKIRVVLNKADTISTQELMRVYGAMMWSLGKVVKTPEVMRVFVGSFWDQPLQNTEMQALFDAEKRDLLSDLAMLPRHAAVRKVNELVKRARLAKTHAYIMGHLRNELPSVFGKKKKQMEMAANLKEEFIKVHRAYNLPPGDFPDINRFRDRLVNTDLDKFPKLRKELVSSMDEILSTHIPQLMRTIQPQGVQAPTPEEMNPFAEDAVDEWTIPPAEKAIYEQRFMQVAVAGKVSGAAAKPVLLETGLPNDVLRPLWAMSDIDRDGSLDMGEFCVALHLAKMARAQGVLPASLPPQLAAVAHREGTVPTPPLGAPPAFAMPSVPVLPPPMPPMMPPRS